MTQRGQRDLLARLADAGEEALTRLAQSPGADRILGVMTNMRDQVDALTSRVRGLEALEARVDELEREVQRLSKASSGRSGTTAARKTSTTSSSRKTSSSTSSSARKTGGSTKKS